MIRALLLIMLATPIGASAAENDPAALWERASQAFQGGRYEGAAAAYQQLVADGHGTADVFFNLGTAQLRARHFGEAVLAYERALRLSPGDADVAFNLNEATKANMDKIVGAREEEPLSERLGARVPLEESGWIFAATWLLAWGALILRLFTRRVRGTLFGASLVIGIVAVISGTMLGLGTWVRANVRYAVVTTPVTSVREGPAKTFKAAFEIHEGLKVRVVGQQEEFERIRLPNGVEGWVTQDEVPVI